MSHYSQVYQIYESIYNHECHPKLEESYFDLTLCYFKARHFDQAIGTYQNCHSQVVGLFEKGESNEYDFHRIALSHNFFGSIYFKSGHFSDAISHFDKALELLIVGEDENGKDFYEQSIASIKTCLSDVYLAMKNFDQSYEYYKQIHDILLSQGLLII